MAFCIGITQWSQTEGPGGKIKWRLHRDCSFGWGWRDQPSFVFTFSEVFRHGLNVTTEREAWVLGAETQAGTNMYKVRGIQYQAGQRWFCKAICVSVTSTTWLSFLRGWYFITVPRISRQSLTSQISSPFKLLWTFEVRKETPVYSRHGPGPRFLNKNRHINYI